MYVRYEITCHGCLLVYAQIYFDIKEKKTRKKERNYGINLCSHTFLVYQMFFF